MIAAPVLGGCERAADIERAADSTAAPSPTVESEQQPIYLGTSAGAYGEGAVIVDGGGCSANLITNEWVLTAQHCIHDIGPLDSPPAPYGYTLKSAPGEYKILYGGRTNPTQVRNVIQLVRHPGNIPDIHSNDLLLMKVSPPFSINGRTSGFRTPLFPYQSSSPLFSWDGKDVVQVGFSTTQAGPCIKPIGDSGVMKLIDPCLGNPLGDPAETAQMGTTTYKTRFWYNPGSYEDLRFLVGRKPNGPMAVKGDSGGPWFTDILNVRYQVTVAAGVSEDLSEAFGSYVAVPNVRQWIYGALIGSNVLVHQVPSADTIYSNIGAAASNVSGVAYLFWINSAKKLVRYVFSSVPQRLTKVDELSGPSGTTFTKDKPAAVVWNGGQIDVFARAENNTLYQRTYANGAWSSAWIEVGWNAASAPAVTSFAAGRLDLFWRSSTNGKLAHRKYSTSTKLWESKANLSDPFVGDPVVVKGVNPASSESDKSIIRVIARLSNNNVVFWNAPKGVINYYAFQNAGGNLPWGPAAAAPSPGRVDIFAANTDGRLRYRWIESQIMDEWVDTTVATATSNGDEHIPTGTGAAANNIPVAVSTSEGTTHVFAIGRNSTSVWHTMYGALPTERICRSGPPYQSCLDSMAVSPTSGSRPAVKQQLGFPETQFWKFRSDGTIRTPTLCLSVISNSLSIGAEIEMTTCDGRSSQRWERKGRWLVNGNSKLCLTDESGVPKQRACVDAGSQVQEWWVDRPAVGAISMANHPGYCMDIRWGSNADYTPLQAYPCRAGDSSQTFNVHPYGRDKIIRIKEKCLDVADGSTAQDAKVQLFECNGTGAQVWQPLADGSLRNPQSGRCLDLNNDDPNYRDPSTGAPSQLQIHDCNGSNAQKWVLPGLVGTD